MEKSWKTIAARILTISTLLAAAGGCDDVEVNVERPPQHPVRPATSPIKPTTRPAQPAPVRSAATGGKSRPAADEPPVEVVADYHQLVLLNEAPPEEAPLGLRYVRVEHAAAEDVGCLLSWLYMPAGPAGSRDRYCLIYPSAAEVDAAARLAPELDVPPVKDVDSSAIPADGSQAMALGVGLLHRGTPSQPPNQQRLRRAEAALAQASADPKLTPARRWLAAMVAGKVAGEYLCDLAAAQHHFADAAAQAEPGSLEYLSSCLAEAYAHIQSGEAQPAIKLVDGILSHPGKAAGTELLDRARRAKAELERCR